MFEKLGTVKLLRLAGLVRSWKLSASKDFLAAIEGDK
jgi:hypothetical protein